MSTEIVNIPEYIKSLFETKEKVGMSKTIDEWDSLDKLDKIKEIKYLIYKYKQLWIGFELLEKLFKCVYLFLPILLLVLIIIGYKSLTLILTLAIIFLVFFVFNRVVKKMSMIYSLEVYLFKDLLKKELKCYH